MMDYFERLAEIESGLNPNAKNPKSTARGLFQFVDDTAQQYGINAPFGTPEYTQQEIDAVQRFTGDNYKALSGALGREPTYGELYLAHQQGAGGAQKLLSNPDARAVDILGRDAVLNNGGAEDMSAADFAGLWVNKFGEPMEQEQYSDEELAAIAGVSLENNYDDYSDEELMKIAGIDQGRQFSKGESAILGTAQGLGFGFADEALAGVKSLPNLLSGDYNEAYDQNLEIARDAFSRAKEQNPWSYGIPEVGGAIATGGAALKAAGKALPTVGKYAGQFAARGPIQAATTAVGAGGVSGGLYGFGSGEGSLQERLDTAKTGGLYGGAGGLVGSVVAPVLAKPIGKLASRASKIFQKNTNSAISSADDLSRIADSKAIQPRGNLIDGDYESSYSKVASALKRDFPDNYQQVLDAWKGGDVSLADLYGNRTRSLAKGAAQYSGGKAVADDFFDERIVNSPDRIKASVSANIDATDDLTAEVEKIVTKGRENAGPLYEKAYKKSIQPSVNVFRPEDNILSKPEIQQAINKARKKYPSELNNLPDESVKVLDYAKRILDDDIGVATRQGEANFARSRTQLKNELLKTIDEQVPFYKRAREISGDYISVQKAAEDGASFTRMDPTELGKYFKSLSNNEREAYKAGVSKAIKDSIDSTTDGSNPYNKIWGKKQNRDRLAKILSPAEYRALETSLRSENRLFKMRNEVLGGSPTASKQIAAAEIGSGLEMLSGGNAATMTLEAIRGAVRKTFDGLNDKTATKISEILYETDPAKKLLIFDRIAKTKRYTDAEKDLIKKAYFTINDQLSARTAGAIGGGVAASGAQKRPVLTDAQGNQYFNDGTGIDAQGNQFMMQE